MYRRQIATIFSNYGLDHLFEKYEVPLNIHGLLDDPAASDALEAQLSIYNFQTANPACFDEFLTYYKVCNHIMKHNPDLPIDYIDFNYTQGYGYH